jgi:two-component system, OmpR family, response regulator
MKTVLVVDDSEVVLALTKVALEKAGYRVVTRDRPSGSVAAILRDKPDIVLLDVNMPSLAGDVIAKILVRAMKNPDTLILLHSSMSIDTLRLKAVATGAHGYIQKTENATELVRRIEWWLAKGVRTHSSSRLDVAPNLSSGPPNVFGAGAPSSSKMRAAVKLDPQSVSTPRSPEAPGSSSGSFRAAMPGPSSGSFRAAKPSAEPSSSRVQKARVLFVDDDWAMLNTYRTIAAAHLQADFASSGDEAYSRILSDSPPDVVVCDILMPGLSGADLYRRATMLDRSWAGRFLFVTGAASTPAVAAFLNDSTVRVFHKPLVPDRLIETVRQMAENTMRAQSVAR